MNERGIRNYANSSIIGQVVIKDLDKNEIILNKFNAINFENMSVAIAKSISGLTTGNMTTMVFGNGGSLVNGVGAITYLPPNVTGTTASLYNQTYSKTGLTSSSSSSVGFDANNNIQINHLNGTFYTDAIVVCTLSYGEPSNQNAFDNDNANGEYVFDEIGLMTEDGSLLSHVIFNPIQKSLNRQIQIQYTIRFAMS